MQKSHKTTLDSKTTAITGNKKILFNIILILFPFVVLLICEIALRSFNYGNDLRLFIKSDNYKGYYEINQKVNLRYFTKVSNTSPTNDIFLIEKPDTCYRVFVLGGSTTRGFPYQAGTSFPRILYYRLQDAFPSKRIEIVNLSASAINSYSYIDMVDELINHEPDAILVYGGHNEYYGALGVGSVENGGNVRWIKKLRLKLNHLKTFQLTQRLVSKLSSIFARKNNESGITLMERIVKNKDIEYNSSLFNKGVNQFRDNMTELVHKAQKNNIPVLLSEIVCNINDQEPFKSANPEVNKAAVDIYNKAKEQEMNGNLDEAKVLYYKAKDLDAIRFRAPEDMNLVIKNICNEYNLPLVPMKSYFEKASPNELIGNELILEHLHPNIDGYFLMADAFFNTLRENNFISDTWDSLKIKPSLYYRNNWGFTELDSLIGDLNIKSLKAGWPFKPENELNEFMSTYKPSGYVDSIAFAYLCSSERHIEDEHVKLAEHYAKAGLNGKAFDEYYSLIKLHPYISYLYYDAVKYLLAENRYSEAFDLLNAAPNIEKDYTYYYTLGNILFRLKKYSNAIPMLEDAYKNISSERKSTDVLIPLHLSYKKVGDKEKELKTLNLIKQIIPEYENEIGKETKIISVPLAEIFDRAKLWMNNGDLEKAKELLLKTNNIKETATANKLIGMIYIQQKQFPLAYQFCSKAYEIDPTDAENMVNLFNLTIMKKDFDFANRILNELRNQNVEEEKLQRLEAFLNKKKSDFESIKK